MAKKSVSDKSPTVAFWSDQIEIYERETKKWYSRSDKIIKRYKDERNDADNARARFNILWSNIQTLAPAIYAKPPVPNVDRRYESDDETGTTTSRVLERCISYFTETDIFDSVLSQVVLDRLLPGRGSVWVRYEPNFKDVEIQGSDEVKEEGSEVTDTVLEGEPQEDDDEEDKEPDQELYSENVVIDYVHFKDYGHTWARTWQEVRGVWRKVYMTRREMKERAFDKWDKIPLDYSDKKTEDDGGGSEAVAKKATIYEIWDKVSKKAIWLHKSMEDVLDERDDPLGLDGFFPCPKPAYATLTNESLIPTPDYIQYQDQAKELDDLTNRITMITKALKVIGVYDKSAEGLSRLLSEGLENTMVPVERWAVFAEKGGMSGVVDWFPLDMVVKTVSELYAAREKVKSDLYEITGISDIIRGQGDASETATASNIKGQYASLRLNSQQKDIARFARDCVRLMAEVICGHFSLDTIKKISGMNLLTDIEKTMLQAKMQPQPPQPGQPPQPPPPVPDEIAELLDQPTWEEIEKLLRDDTLRCFRISIETDSTIKADQDAEKDQRTQFLGAAGQFMLQSVQLPAAMQPLAAEMLMFGIRGFKVARDIETTFDVAIKKLKDAANEPPPPNPETEKNQMQFQNDQQKNQLTAAELQQRGKEHEANMGLEMSKLQAEVIKARLDAKTKVHPDVAISDPDFHDGQPPLSQMMQMVMQHMNQGFQQLALLQAKGDQAIIQAISQPRHTKVLRDAQGRIQEGVSSVLPQTVQ